MKKYILTLLVFCAFTSIEAQVKDYADPIPVDSLNSEAEESMPLFDPVNKTMFIVRTFHPDNTGGKLSGNEIWAFNRNEANQYVDSDYNFDLLNNKNSNAVVGIAEGGKKLYLLNKYLPEGKTKKGISTSTLKNGKWTKPKNLAINGITDKTKIYSIYVNPTEDVMLLSMRTATPDSVYGIFIAEGNSGKWTNPTLVEGINSPNSNEISPYISSDKKTIFFASDREGGKGDYDIYKAQKENNSTSWGNIENLEFLNSSKFDAYLSLAESNNMYFVSNRNGKMADVFMTSMKNDSLDAIETKGVDGVDKEGNVVSIHPNVNFEFDKYSLNKSAKNYLSTIVDSLKSNKKWKVTLDGHTDNRGSNSYNLTLAKNRALETRNYLIMNGISAGRIKINYYGENRPTTSNKTDFGRYMNRRVEIKFRKPTNN